MTITAKYASICPTCRQSIAPGQKVEWAKGSQARHATCAAGGVAPIAPVAAKLGRRQTFGQRRQAFGTDAGAASNVRGYSGYCTANPGCRCYDCAS